MIENLVYVDYAQLKWHLHDGKNKKNEENLYAMKHFHFQRNSTEAIPW